MWRKGLLPAVLGAFACSSAVPADHSESGAAPSSPVTAQASAPPSAGRVIGSLALKGERLTIVASGTGPRFEVADNDGRVLSRDLDIAELAERHSDLYEVYRYGTARGPFLDARLDRERSVPHADDPR
jgi:hypothetical protein